MAPDYKLLGSKLNTEDSEIKIAKLDATIHKKFSSKAGVKGFPTLKFYINSNPIDYKGKREEKSIYEWIMKKIGPSSSLIEDLT